MYTYIPSLLIRFISQVSIASFSLKIRKNHVFTYRVSGKDCYTILSLSYTHTLTQYSKY